MATGLCQHRIRHRSHQEENPAASVTALGRSFSIYSKAAEEEDNKMAERWQKDADGILIFVSPRVAIHAARA
jgi:hypothetical protein